MAETIRPRLQSEPTNPTPGILVVYDVNASVAPSEITQGLRGFGPSYVLFVSPDAAAHAPFFGSGVQQLSLEDGYPAVMELLRRLRPGGILTFNESALRLTGKLAEDLELPYNSYQTIELLTDKALQRNRLNGAGIGAVRTHTLNTPADWWDAVDRVGLPAVIKPVHGRGSRNTFQIDDPTHGAEVVAGLLGATSDSESALVVEELLVGRPSGPFGDFVSVESISAAGEITHLAVTGKFPLLPPFREAGHFWATHLDEMEQQELFALTTKALQALGVTEGITHTEFKLTAEGPRIIEVNGRIGGYIGELARLAVGTDLTTLAARVALGERPAIERALPERIYFLYNNQPPLVRCQLDAVQGIDLVRQHPNVVRYRTFIPPGARLDGNVGTTHLDMIYGFADNHEQMFTVLKEVLADLTFVYSQLDDAAAEG